MISKRRTAKSLAGLAIISSGLAAVPARGALSASATVTTSQTSAPFTYTITLKNTGDTNIGTLWYAWTDTPTDYDFLPTQPSNVTVPSGWVEILSHNGIPGDGYGLEMYNISGSAIPSGGTGTFTFTSNDTPTQLAGNAYIAPNKVGTSFVYIGFPQGDQGFEFNAAVQVPEPSSMLALSVVGLCAVARPRRRSTV